MKKFTILVVILLALFNEAALVAQQDTLKSPLVVVLNFKEAADNSDFCKTELIKLTAKVEVHKAAVEKKQTYINELFTKLQEPGQTSVTQEFYSSELRTVQRFVEDTNIEITDLNKKTTSIINRYIQEAVVKYTKQKNINIVLLSSQVYSVSDNYNITTDFISYLNKEYGK